MPETISVHRRFFEATRPVRDLAEFDVRTPEVDRCAYCGRRFDTVEEPGQAVRYQYSASTTPLWLCTTCYTPHLGSYGALGVERKAGSSGKTVPAKIGMLPGSGGVITASDELHFAFPPKNVEKYREGWYGRHGRLHQERPLQLLVNLYREGRLGPVRKGIIFIDEFGRKSSSLMVGMRLTTDLRELWGYGKSGRRVRNFAALMKLAEIVQRYGHADKAVRPAFWRPIREAAEGHYDAEATQKWVDATEGALEIIAHLPVDPVDRLYLAGDMHAIMGP